MSICRINILFLFALVFASITPYSPPTLASSSPESSKKVALVTGASRGIGFALTKELLTEGLQVIAVARKVDSLVELKKEFPSQLQIISADLSTNEGQLSVAPAVLAPKLDYLVHNAAIIEPLGKNALLEATPEDIQKIMNLNVVAPMILTNQLASKFVPGSRVLMVSSRAGDKVIPGMGLYCLSKTAIDRYTESLKLDLPLGILAACVHPGDIDTDMQGDLRKHAGSNFPLHKFFLERKDSLTSAVISGRYLAWLLIKTPDREYVSQKHNIYEACHHFLWNNGEVVHDPFPGHEIK